MNDESRETIRAIVTAPSLSRRDIEVEIDAAETARTFENVLQDFSSRARLDGFRRGKAPKEMVKRLFFEEIREAVIDDLASKALTESLRKNNIRPVGTPVIRDVVFREGEPLRFKAVVEVIPDFDLPPYKNIRIAKRSVTVEDREIDAALEELRQKSAEFVPAADRPVRDGDYVVLESKGRDLKTKRFLPTEKILVLAGHPENEKDLNESLIGLRPQESRQLTITYPADHPQKKLAGRAIAYDIKVLSVKEKRIPEMGDEWAKDLGDYGSLADLREKVRQELLAEKEEKVRREMGDDIVAQIIDKLDVELPESLVAEETKEVLGRWATASPSGLPSAEPDELNDRARAQAQRNLKRALLLRKIAAVERLTVSDEEVEEEIRRLAKKNQIPVARLIENLNREGRREDLKAALLQRKTVDFLFQNAVLY